MASITEIRNSGDRYETAGGSVQHLSASGHLTGNIPSHRANDVVTLPESLQQWKMQEFDPKEVLIPRNPRSHKRRDTNFSKEFEAGNAALVPMNIRGNFPEI